MRIVAVATQEEKRLIARFLNKGEYDLVVVTGVGGTNVIKTLQKFPRCYCIINIGFAGSATIPKGQAVKVKQVSLYHKECNYNEPTFTLAEDGANCFTSCDFVGDKTAENSVFDMELAFIAALGFKKLDSYKVISDNIDYEEYKNTIATL